jgi:hypothetical protein
LPWIARLFERLARDEGRDRAIRTFNATETRENSQPSSDDHDTKLVEPTISSNLCASRYHSLRREDLDRPSPFPWLEHAIADHRRQVRNDS